MKICHILGSDIPHHNQTVMNFFYHQLWNKIPAQARAHFYLVGAPTPDDLTEVVRFNSKKALADFLIKEAKQQSDIFYLFHGQFNLWIWLAILCHRLPMARIGWHIWGADLYEDSDKWQFKLFYPLRRLAQKKLRYVFATAGDLVHFRTLNPDAVLMRLYFPTKMDLNLHVVQSAVRHQPLTILLGNSGDQSNRHLEALQHIKQRLGNNVQLLIPMGYPTNNQDYINRVKTRAYDLFSPSRVTVFDQNIEFQDYLAMLAKCDLGYFAFARQQGIGTICLLIQLNIPIVLNTANPFCMDMQQQQIPFIEQSVLSHEYVAEVKVRLEQVDKAKIEFFSPNFIQNWQQLLVYFSTQLERK